MSPDLLSNGPTFSFVFLLSPMCLQKHFLLPFTFLTRFNSIWALACLTWTESLYPSHAKHPCFMLCMLPFCVQVWLEEFRYTAWIPACWDGSLLGLEEVTLKYKPAFCPPGPYPMGLHRADPWRPKMAHFVSLPFPHGKRALLLKAMNTSSSLWIYI